MNRLVFGILCTCLAAACSGGSGLGLVTTEEEVEFGSVAHEELLTEYQECLDCRQLVVDQASGLTITAYVNALGQQLAAEGNPDRGATYNQIPQWTFTILDSEEVNAFALPGGYVYVTTGLLDIAANKAELAGIVGHEVGHVTNYHGVQRIESFMLAEGITSLLFGSDSEMSEYAQIFVGAYDHFVNSKDDELEADSSGVRYSYGVGFDPYQMNLFFEAILPAYEDMDPVSAGLSNILSSHPHPQDRIDGVNTTAAGLGVAPGTPGLTVDDAAVPLAAVQQALASRAGAVAARDGRLENLSARTQALLRACTIDLETRALVTLSGSSH